MRLFNTTTIFNGSITYFMDRAILDSLAGCPNNRVSTEIFRVTAKLSKIVFISIEWILWDRAILDRLAGCPNNRVSY